MKFCKRMLAAVVLLLAAAVLLLSVAGGIGVWVVKEPVTARATLVFERIAAALDAADQALDHGDKSLAGAAKRLEEAREEQKGKAPPPGWRRTLAQTLQQTIAPERGSPHEQLLTVAEAAVVVQSVLKDLGNFPLLSISGPDLAPLAEIKSSLSAVESSAWELTRLLGPGTGTDADADAQISRIDQALKTMRRSINNYKSQVAQVRQRTEALRSKVLSGITPAAVLVSVACFWIALSQVSLLCHACSWWRHAARNDKRPG